MANTIISPNMNLPVPVVGVDPGPDWANNVNSSLNLIDAHDHTSGSGVQITPSGLNINADLNIQSNNVTGLRSSRYVAQSMPLSTGSSSDIGCVYVAGLDLYYNDISGNQVRITSGGGVAGSPGSISNLNSPASAAYVSGTGTFVWQSNTNIAANMDAGSIILRNITLGSFGVTLSPPNSLSSNYTITLPTVPASTKIMSMDNAGTITSAVDADGATLQFSANTLSVKNSGVGTNQLADGSVTNVKLGAAAVTLSKIDATSAFPSQKHQTFTTSGSFSFVVGSYSQVQARICGSGGGGGGGSGAGNGAGGGGSGSVPFLVDIIVVPGETLNIFIPIHGSGGKKGNSGGSSGTIGSNGATAIITRVSDSSILARCQGGVGGGAGTVSGGGGGSGGSSSDYIRSAAGTGGSSSSGGNGADGSFYGSAGTGGSHFSGTGSGGGGGGAGIGSGGNGASAVSGQAGGQGQNGQGSGAGGGGGGSGDSGFAGGDGGAGADGEVTLAWVDWG